VSEALHLYLDALVAELKAVLGDALVGVYLSGSGAVRAYRPGSSDVDVLVVASPAERAALDAIVAGCSHERLPCPAQKLELVVYEGSEVAAPGPHPRWSLNFDTGRDVHQVDYDSKTLPSHWFVLDLAFARVHGRTLAGPPAADLIGAVPDDVVGAAFDDQVAWYRLNEPGDAAELAALRADHWRETGRFAAKTDFSS
jgi:hypothetical protein